jgi:hypothetical protein
MVQATNQNPESARIRRALRITTCQPCLPASGLTGKTICLSDWGGVKLIDDMAGAGAKSNRLAMRDILLFSELPVEVLYYQMDHRLPWLLAGLRPIHPLHWPRKELVALN